LKKEVVESGRQKIETATVSSISKFFLVVVEGEGGRERGGKNDRGREGEDRCERGQRIKLDIIQPLLPPSYTPAFQCRKERIVALFRTS